jgi:hypothetical protein
MRKHRRIRSKKAFVLIAILTFSVFAIAMIFALMPLVLSQVRSESTNRSMNELRVAAEIGIDYGIKQLNDFAATNSGGTNSFDLNTTTVPSTYLTGITTNSVKVRVSAISPNSWKKFGAIYSDRIDGPTGLNPLLDPSKDTWRVLDSTASNGFLSKSIRVFLEPRYDIPPSNLTPGGGTTPLQSYFNNSMLSAGTLNLSPSLGTLSLSTYSPGGVGGTPATPQGSTVNIGASDTVNVTGTLTTSQPTLIPPPSATISTIKTSMPVDPLPQAPEAGTAVPLPPTTGNSQLDQGSYTTATLTNATTSATIDSPVKIFIQDSNAAPSAVDISSANIKNTSSESAGGAKNLQIWYDGSRPIQITMVDGSPFKGLVYAPNSTISLFGKGQFIGALVGKNITMQNSGDLSVEIDTSVQDPASLGSSGKGLSYTLDNKGYMYLQGYKAVAWKELSGSLVP